MNYNTQYFFFFFLQYQRYYMENTASCICVCWFITMFSPQQRCSNLVVFYYLPRDKCVYNTCFLLQNSTLTIEEFHSKLQEATNFPLRPFVIPFLKVLDDSLVCRVFQSILLLSHNSVSFQDWRGVRSLRVFLPEYIWFPDHF